MVILPTRIVAGSGDDASPISFVSPKSSLVEKILINPMAIAKGARVVPAVKDGQPEGFKLYAIRPASLYARIKLMNGDTIQSINGHRLDTADKALEVYTALRDAKRLEIGLLRRGRPLTITITE